MTFTDKFLKAVATGEKNKVENTKKTKRFEKERKKKLKIKFKNVQDKYTEPLQNVLIDTASYGIYSLSFRFIRADFTGWHKIVEGGYCNANPVLLINSMLVYMQRTGAIPDCVQYKFVNEKTCEVQFTWLPTKKIMKTP